MAYSVHLAQFDGPLDLLLHLIQRAQLDIKEIFVSEITSQYLACMDELDELDMDTASEFLAMAATLLLIKSRQLLPRPPLEKDEEDPETLLIRQLREYKAFKEAGEGLAVLYRDAQNSIARLPEDVALPPHWVELENATLDGLFSAFCELLKRTETEADEPTAHVRPDRYTVRAQMRRIREILAASGTVRFEELFLNGAERMEMIVTFLALLEMLSHGEVGVRQKAPFSPIRISAKTLLTDESDVYSYMDETEL